MRNQYKILIAFILNLSFSLFELVGGIFTGSAAILSDSVHDLGDAVGIGVSFFMEKKSNRQADNHYTYGYGRFSVLGSTITTLLLLVGSLAAISNAVFRIVKPSPVDYNGMIGFAVVGLLVNGAAVLVTTKGQSMNQRAVSLHMLEDVLGWAVVLIGAVVMRFTGFAILDPILSLGVGVFILLHAVEHIKGGMEVLLEKAPDGVDVEEVLAEIFALNEVVKVERFHVLSTDGQKCFAALHVIVNECSQNIKTQILGILHNRGIDQVILELST